MTLNHAPRAVGLPERQMDHGGIRTLIPWVQARCPAVGRRARYFFQALREGFEPSSPTFGGSRSDPIELPQHMIQAGFEPAPGRF